MITINDKEDCMGCHACSNICPQQCITMESDSEGFMYPKVEVKRCVDCGLCKKVCPILHKVPIQNDPRAYACFNIDDEVRMESSSGGIFSLIANQVIDNGGVVFGAIFNKNFTVVHSYVDTKEELIELRGSKYVQSIIGKSYKQAKDFLNKGRQVLFTGTPCQIGGLKSYLGQNYDNLICIDNICHGVPSPKVWKKYICYQENCFGTPTRRIAFRRKDEGWKRYSVSFLFNNNTEYIQTHNKDLYMKTFLKNVCLRPSCYACKFKTLHRESDITLADFWGIQNILSEMNDDKGTSLIFVNSNRGELIFQQIKDKTSYKQVDINKAIHFNPSAIKSAKLNPKREKFFSEVDQLSFNKLVYKHCIDGILVRTKIKVKSIVRIVLKNMGLLNGIKKV